MKIDWTDLEKKLRKELSTDRYTHTLGVTYTACALAMRYEVDLDQARAGGLLHDCAKCLSNKKKLQMCEKSKIKITPLERENAFLLHSKLGAHMAKAVYGIDDEAVMNAIRWHTTGTANMTMLEKIVFTADYIEPNRCKAPRLAYLRKLAFEDLDLCVYEILKDTISYLNHNPKAMDPSSVEAFQYYENLTKDRRSESE